MASDDPEGPQGPQEHPRPTGAEDARASEPRSQESGEPASPRPSGDSRSPGEQSAFGPLEALERAVVAYWRVQALARIVVLGLVVWVVLPPLLADGARELQQIQMNVGIAVLVALGLGWWASGARYRRFRFAVSDRSLYVRDGVLWHREKVIPVQRMQHVDIQRGPIERMLGLASLSVFTAGGGGATFRLPGLAPERGDRLRDHVLAAREAS